MTPLTESQHISTIPRKKNRKRKRGALCSLSMLITAMTQHKKKIQGEERDLRNIESASSTGKIRSCKVESHLHQHTKRFSHGGCCANCDRQIVQNRLSQNEKKLQVEFFIETNFRVLNILKRNVGRE
jgi:hypothetical protein